MTRRERLERRLEQHQEWSARAKARCAVASAKAKLLSDLALQREREALP